MTTLRPVAPRSTPTTTWATMPKRVSPRTPGSSPTAADPPAPRPGGTRPRRPPPARRPPAPRVTEALVCHRGAIFLPLCPRSASAVGRSGDHQGEQSSAVDGLERALVTAGLARHPIVRPWQESGSCSVRAIPQSTTRRRKYRLNGFSAARGRVVWRATGGGWVAAVGVLRSGGSPPQDHRRDMQRGYQGGSV